MVNLLALKFELTRLQKRALNRTVHQTNIARLMPDIARYDLSARALSLLLRATVALRMIGIIELWPNLAGLAPVSLQPAQVSS
jgi:hypothetical protein